MIVTALTCSVLSVIMYITLVARFSKRSLYLMNGYSQWVDLFFSVFVIGLSATTATTTALLISAFTGVFLSIALVLLRRYLGYMTVKRVKGKWFKFEYIKHAPINTLPSWLSKIDSLLPTVDRAYSNA